MPIQINSPFYERVFIQPQSDPRLLPASGGVWTSAGAQLVRAMSGSLTMNAAEAWVQAQWKHSSRSALPKFRGRKNGAWTLTIPLAPSGTPGTPPDCDPLLQAIFGGAPTIAAGVSVGYNIFDQGVIPLGILDFCQGFTTTGNRYTLGALPQRVGITFNGNLLEINASGTAISVVQVEEFPIIADSIPKGGLSTFPIQPSSFSIVGSIIPGFGGILTLDGNQIIKQCDRFSVEFDTGFDYKGDFVDDAYGAQILKNLRTVSVDIGMMNTTDPALIDLKQKARLGSAINGSFVLGTVNGYIVTATFNGLQLNPSSISEAGGYFSVSFGNSQGSVAPGNSNEFALTLS